MCWHITCQCLQSQCLKLLLAASFHSWTERDQHFGSIDCILGLRDQHFGSIDCILGLRDQHFGSIDCKIAIFVVEGGGPMCTWSLTYLQLLGRA